jgi:hypothetical protein
MTPPAWLPADWIDLRQHWRGPAGPEAGFRPARARFERRPDGLRFEVVLEELAPGNRAASLNERTWRLGSVCEIFVRHRADRYLELHVTPENRRLQLDWPLGGLAEIRAGRARLEDFMVPDEGWCRTAAAAVPGGWRLEADFAVDGPELLAAVCRYDCSQPDHPILSSTALLAEPAFHRWQEWHRLAPG